MEDPRPIKAYELPSLSRLVDTVFRGQIDGWMFAQFPTLFNEENLDNLIVVTEGKTVISHVGMTQRWASLAGCTVRVACIGAVSTYEEYRGKGLATQLFDHACAKARAEGVDFLLISGGRGMYRRAGAADVGHDFKAVLNGAAAATLAEPALTVRDFTEADLDSCMAAYRAKVARFIRPLDDWRGYLRCFVHTTGENRLAVILRHGIFRGYIVYHRANPEGKGHIVEYAGEEHAIAGAVQRILEDGAMRALDIHLQSTDRMLREVLAGAGVTLEPIHSSGTVLLINFPQLMHRLQPFLEDRAGLSSAKSLTFTECGDTCTFRYGQNEFRAAGKMAAAQRIFGDPERRDMRDEWDRLFPVPVLWYGINYV